MNLRGVARCARTSARVLQSIPKRLGKLQIRFSGAQQGNVGMNPINHPTGGFLSGNPQVHCLIPYLPHQQVVALELFCGRLAWYGRSIAHLRPREKARDMLSFLLKVMVMDMQVCTEGVPEWVSKPKGYLPTNDTLRCPSFQEALARC